MNLLVIYLCVNHFVILNKKTNLGPNHKVNKKLVYTSAIEGMHQKSNTLIVICGTIKQRGTKGL